MGAFEDRRLTGALLAQLHDPDPELRRKVSRRWSGWMP
jgi:hypothetical protein